MRVVVSPNQSKTYHLWLYELHGVLQLYMALQLLTRILYRASLEAAVSTPSAKWRPKKKRSVHFEGSTNSSSGDDSGLSSKPSNLCSTCGKRKSILKNGGKQNVKWMSGFWVNLSSLTKFKSFEDLWLMDFTNWHFCSPLTVTRIQISYIAVPPVAKSPKATNWREKTKGKGRIIPWFKTLRKVRKSLVLDEQLLNDLLIIWNTSKNSTSVIIDASNIIEAKLYEKT